MLTLAITGFAADPADVTRILHIQPSATAMVGQPRPGGKGAPYDFNGWWLTLRSTILADRGVEAIAEIVTLLSGREASFQRVRQELRPERTEIYGAMEVPKGDQCGIWLDTHAMTVLAGCGVGWGIDLVSVDR